MKVKIISFGMATALFACLLTGCSTSASTFQETATDQVKIQRANSADTGQDLLSSESTKREYMMDLEDDNRVIVIFDEYEGYSAVQHSSEILFSDYSGNDVGKIRFIVHDEDEALQGTSIHEMLENGGEFETMSDSFAILSDGQNNVYVNFLSDEVTAVLEVPTSDSKIAELLTYHCDGNVTSPLGGDDVDGDISAMDGDASQYEVDEVSFEDGDVTVSLDVLDGGSANDFALYEQDDCFVVTEADQTPLFLGSTRSAEPFKLLLDIIDLSGSDQQDQFVARGENSAILNISSGDYELYEYVYMFPSEDEEEQDALTVMFTDKADRDLLSVLHVEYKGERIDLLGDLEEDEIDLDETGLDPVPAQSDPAKAGVIDHVGFAPGISITEFLNQGWEVETEGEYSFVNMSNPEYANTEMRLYDGTLNSGITSLDLDKGVYGYDIDVSSVKFDPIPPASWRGVTWGSSYDDIQEQYGVADSVYDGDLYSSYTYDLSDNETMTFYVWNPDKGGVDGLAEVDYRYYR